MPNILFRSWRPCDDSHHLRARRDVPSVDDCIQPVHHFGDVNPFQVQSMQALELCDEEFQISILLCEPAEMIAILDPPIPGTNPKGPPLKRIYVAFEERRSFKRRETDRVLICTERANDSGECSTSTAWTADHIETRFQLGQDF